LPKQYYADDEEMKTRLLVHTGQKTKMANKPV